MSNEIALDNHEYIASFKQEIKDIEDCITTDAVYALDLDEDGYIDTDFSDDLRDEISEDDLEKISDFINSHNINNLTLSEAKEAIELVESARNIEVIGPDEKGFEEYDAAQDKLAGMKSQLVQINAIIAQLGNMIEAVSTSSKSISTYVTVRAGFFKDDDGNIDLDRIEGLTTNFQSSEVFSESEDFSSDDLVQIRISDHEPSGGFGDYGYHDYNTGDVDIYLS